MVKGVFAPDPCSPVGSPHEAPYDTVSAELGAVASCRV